MCVCVCEGSKSMSCNGCRILRKGCNDNCVLRQSLQGIESPKAQSNATLFLSKFFGRATLISFLSSVPQSQRPPLFQSLLFEACGRTVNPVSGAVGLLWRGNWHVCQGAVETVLLGGILRALPEYSGGGGADENDLYGTRDLNARLKVGLGSEIREETRGLDLGRMVGFPANMTAGARVRRRGGKRRQPAEESETTTLESGVGWAQGLERDEEIKLLGLFF